jgi:hypothetical protein
MLKTKSNNSFNILWFITIFSLINIVTYAQDNSWPAAPVKPSSYSLTQTKDTSKHVETPAPQEQSPATQDLSFSTDAMQLANELIQKTGLSTDKSEKISDYLKNYRNEIAKARDHYSENINDKENAGGIPSKTDMSGILGDNVEKYYTGSATSLMKNYKEADRKMDNKMKDLFDNDVQKSRYGQVKAQWWNDVKAKVFSTLNTPSQNLTK